ncbi:ABC transporter permease [Saccharospirillum impatiens]|uniref:ABC transporter permease n=1 Tax=Saccharospirillum impatiens TaxID=169438 RepID=UPI000406E33E|nr:FtsX-like permease family protein [Saccharospirillum impatiens]
MRFQWLVAVRFLRQGRFQSVLIGVGVAVGVAIIVFLTALINGLQVSLIDDTLGTQAHIVLKPRDERARKLMTETDRQVLTRVQQSPQRLTTLDQWQSLLPALSRSAGVRSVSPLVSGPALAIQGSAERNITLLGIDPVSYSRQIPVRDRLVAGAYELGPDQVLIGVALADELGLDIGGRLRLATGQRDRVVSVAGIFDLGLRELNLGVVYMHLRSAQTLLDLPGGVSRIQLQVRDIFAADIIANQLERTYSLESESWMSTNGELLNGLRSQSLSSDIIRFFIGVSVAFGIASVLVVSVVQRSREIGILRATGTSRRQVIGIFLLQGGLLGLGGSLFGLLSAGGLVLVFTRLVPGLPFPIPLTVPLLVWTAVLATVTGLISAVVPALRAARLDPVEAIRG